MILHVLFTDGSNPWVCFSNDTHEITDHWKEWEKSFPWEEAQITAYNGDYICKRAEDSSGYWVYKQGEYWDTVKRYKYLGNALKALAKQGGETV